MTNHPTVSQSPFILYISQNGEVNVDVFIKNETVWLTQKSISELFGVDRSVVTKHFKNIFDSGELEENSVCAILARTATGRNNAHYRQEKY